MAMAAFPDKNSEMFLKPVRKKTRNSGYKFFTKWTLMVMEL
jgi:hypothetical protein